MKMMKGQRIYRYINDSQEKNAIFKKWQKNALF